MPSSHAVDDDLDDDLDEEVVEPEIEPDEDDEPDEKPKPRKSVARRVAEEPAEVKENPEDRWDWEDRDWPYEFIDFEGDRLAVRAPTQQALSAFSLGVSKFVKPETQNNLTGLFIERHMSGPTYDRVMSRMMDPDDPTYTTKTVGELMGRVVRLTGEKLAAKREAKALKGTPRRK